MGKKSTAKWHRRNEARRDARERELAERLRIRSEAENPPENTERYAHLSDWGLTLPEIAKEARLIAMSAVSVDEPFDVRFVDLGPSDQAPVGHWNVRDRHIELHERRWRQRAGWQRLVAIAHEVFHVYQHEAIARWKSGNRKVDDPDTSIVEGWASYTGPYDIDLANRFLAGKAAKLELLEMLEAYFGHVYEADAETFGRSYLATRGGEI